MIYVNMYWPKPASISGPYSGYECVDHHDSKFGLFAAVVFCNGGIFTPKFPPAWSFGIELVKYRIEKYITLF